MLYYLYGIVKSGTAGNTAGIFEVSFKDISGVAGEVTPEEFGEGPLKKNLESMEWLKEKVFRHEKVIEDIMKKTTVIPMKFCTLFSSRGSILEVLEQKYDYFKKLLERFSDKHEWGLKIYCNKNKEKPVKVPDSGREYLITKIKENEKASEDEQRLNAAIEEFFRKIKDLAEDIKLNRPTPKELLSFNDKEQIVNTSLLIPDSNVNELNDLLKQYIEQGIILELVGPLPVYSFIGDLHANNE